jgi:hypothetical protein
MKERSKMRQRVGFTPPCCFEKEMQNKAACKIHAASSSPSLLLLQEESIQGKKKQIETACGMHAVSHFRGGKKKQK